jgi:hypothetical protein
MFFSRVFGRGGADDDLAEYRAGYPKTAVREDKNACDNLRFYQNKIAGTDGVFIDRFHERLFGAYAALEQGHSYVQWLCPIREQSAFNNDSQPLMLHEIAAMKADPAIMKRVFLSTRLMLDFYGFDLNVDALPAGAAAPAASASAAASAAPGASGAAATSKAVAANSTAKAKPSGDDEECDDEAPRGPATVSTAPALLWQSPTFPWLQLGQCRVSVTRQQDARAWRPKFRNLLDHGHNNLRITRINKFVGELGLENVKVAILIGFRTEIFETGMLKSLAQSYLRYWSGTVYDDATRARLQQIPGAKQ